MPVTKSAKKKLKKDKKREKENAILESLYKGALKKAKKNPTEKNIKEAAVLIDKAAKKNIIHKNKAARNKSSLAKISKVKKTSKKLIHNQ